MAIPSESGITPAEVAKAAGLGDYSAERVFTSEEVEAVHRALADEKWDYRTPKGISVETGLPEDQVLHMLRASDFAFETPFKTTEQQPVFRRADEQPTFRERAEAIRWMLAR